MASPDAEEPQDDGKEDVSVIDAIREDPSIAARAGAIAPLLGIFLLLALGLTVNAWVGVGVGLAATLIALPLTLWLLARRR